MHEGIPKPSANTSETNKDTSNKASRVFKRVVLAAGLALSPLATFAQQQKDTAQQTKETLNEYENETYTTRDGNIRYFHNPSSLLETQGGDQNVTYSVGATKCPFQNLEEIKLKTRTPESLAETDFFCNYINAGLTTDHVLVDTHTGNRYVNYKEYNSMRDHVNYEGQNHWNIQRFLIEPHYDFFGVEKKQGRTDALYDIYKYFLYTEKGNRDTAWQKANEFMTKNVDCIVNSDYANWANKNYRRLGLATTDPDSSQYIGDSNLFSADNTTTLVGIVLRYNSSMLGGAEKNLFQQNGPLFTREEIEHILIDYNIQYRKKDLETATQITKDCIESELKKYKDEIESYRNKPLENGFTEEEKMKILKFFETFKFADSQ